jgi:hypothetical protein
MRKNLPIFHGDGSICFFSSCVGSAILVVKKSHLSVFGKSDFRKTIFVRLRIIEKVKWFKGLVTISSDEYNQGKSFQGCVISLLSMETFIDPQLLTDK